MTTTQKIMTEPHITKPQTLNTQPVTRENIDELSSVVHDLSPTSQANAILLLQSLRKKEAIFGEDTQGRPVIQYKDERSRKLWWDTSNANIITQPRSDEDIQLKMDACLELIDYLKKNKPPSGLVLDPTHVNPRSGHYRESKEFIQTTAVLGTGNSAGDIIVVKDKKTQTESAQKTMMISVFREEEIRAWVDLNETGIPPALYCFKLEGNRIHIFMEKIDNGVTLRDVIDRHMGYIRAKDPYLVRPFSLYVFHGLLSAVHTMHKKGWTHKDLHPGNIMLQESPEGVIQTRILDFGLAKRLDSEDGYRGFRSDMAEVVRKFTALYVDQEFDSELDVRRNWKEKLSEMATVYSLSQADKVELFCLVESALQVTSIYDVPKLQQEIATNLDFNIASLSTEVAKILFAKPDSQNIKWHSGSIVGKTSEHPNVVDLASELRKIKLVLGPSRKLEQSTMDTADSSDVIFEDNYFTNEEINDDFLDNLRKQTGVGW